MSFQMPITIAKAIGEIQANRYVLPAIQREFVWSAEQIEKLFDSLMRGYPIGSFLLWQIDPQNLDDFRFYRFMDRYHQRDHRHNEPLPLVGKHNVIAILDGQQRLTALNIGLRGWYAYKLPWYRWSSDYAFPRQRLYLNLMGPPDDIEFAYEFRMLRDKEVQNPDGGEFWFPVGEVLEFKDLPEVYDYCHDHNLTAGSKFPHRALMRLWEVVNKEPVINYYLEEEQDLDKVLNIFIRVNSGGTQLSYSDMLLSIATAQWQEKDAREEIYDLVDSLNAVGEGFNFNKDFVLKASLVLADIPAIEFKVNNFNRQNMLAIEEQWDGIARALRLTANLLASWGYNRETLISNNAVIPLAYYLYRQGNPVNFVGSGHYKDNRDHMHHWLMIALLKRTFSGQPDNVLRAIRRVISEHHDRFPMHHIFDALRPTAKSMTFDQAQLDGLLGYQYGQPYTFSVLVFLYPWLNFEHHFHIDHIFPRSMFTEKELEKRGIPRDQWHRWLDHVNDLANLQLLQGIANQEKADKEFEAWLQSSQQTPLEMTAYRELHIIPDVDLSFESFPGFLEAREQAIKKRLADLLEIQGSSSQVGE
jgi:hypothetical protein